MGAGGVVPPAALRACDMHCCLSLTDSLWANALVRAGEAVLLSRVPLGALGHCLQLMSFLRCSVAFWS